MNYCYGAQHKCLRQETWGKKKGCGLLQSIAGGGVLAAFCPFASQLSCKNARTTCLGDRISKNREACLEIALREWEVTGTHYCDVAFAILPADHSQQL